MVRLTLDLEELVSPGARRLLASGVRWLFPPSSSLVCGCRLKLELILLSEVGADGVEEEEVEGLNLNSRTTLTFRLEALTTDVGLRGGRRLVLGGAEAEGVDEEWNLNCSMTLRLMLEADPGDLSASLSFSREDDLDGEATLSLVLLALVELDCVASFSVTGSVTFLKSLKESFQLTERDDEDWLRLVDLFSF